jgi:hypothetical protein
MSSFVLLLQPDLEFCKSAIEASVSQEEICA